MKRLVLRENDELTKERYPKDVKRLVKICKDRGFVIDKVVAKMAWKQFSEDMCAGWMMLDCFTEGQIFITIKDRCKISKE